MLHAPKFRFYGKAIFNDNINEDVEGSGSGLGQGGGLRTWDGSDLMRVLFGLLFCVWKKSNDRDKNGDTCACRGNKLWTIIWVRPVMYVAAVGVR